MSQLTEAQKIIAKNMSEETLQNSIVELAHSLHWLVHAERPARTADGWRTPVQGDKGFPDLVLAKNKMVIMAELKSENGTISEAQQVWWRAIESPKFQLWRPRDWVTGYIECMLRG